MRAIGTTKEEVHDRTGWRKIGDHNYDKKRRQGKPAKRCRDDLDKYWSDTI